MQKHKNNNQNIGQEGDTNQGMPNDSKRLHAQVEDGNSGG